jgi:hypothetical protein
LIEFHSSLFYLHFGSKLRERLGIVPLAADFLGVNGFFRAMIETRPATVAAVGIEYGFWIEGFR